MSRYLPIVLGVIVIFGLTAVQFQMTDRLSDTNITAEQRAQLLKNVPERIGNWHGEDIPVDPNIQRTAGAVGAVSRVYRNIRTGDVVDLWLIVGHARVVTGHTPDICYPSSGFETRSTTNSLYPIVVSGEPEAAFFTNTFFREDVSGRRLVRVFWAWHDPKSTDDSGTVQWEAPENARFYFGNSRALYKMYFTSEMRDSMETAEQSPCVRFAEEFLPVVNRALAEVHSDSPSAEDPPREEFAEPVAAEPVAAEPVVPAADVVVPEVTPELTGELETFAEPADVLEIDLDEPASLPAADVFDNLFDDSAPSERE